MASPKGRETDEEEPRRRRISGRTTMVVNKQLPDVIVREILLNVPAKAILRFRAVCKVWRSLISDPAFVQAHTPYVKTLVLLRSRILRSRNEVDGDNYFLEIQDDGAMLQMRLEKAQPIIIPASLDRNHSWWISLDACDGFLCILEIPNDTRLAVKRYYFSNLYRKEWTAVTIPHHLKFHELIALYFHSSTGEYRLLFLVTKKGSQGKYYPEFYVFILQGRARAGRWRLIHNFLYDDEGSPTNELLMQELPYLYFEGVSKHVKLSGCIYAIGRSYILAFDVDIEKFRMIIPPRRLYQTSHLIKLNMGSFLGLIHVWYELEIQIWSLKDRGYGSTEEWTKLHTISSEIIASPLRGEFRAAGVFPLMVSNAGDELLLKLRRWAGPKFCEESDDEESMDEITFVLYNFKSKAIVKRTVVDLPLYAHAMWTETLSCLFRAH